LKTGTIIAYSGTHGTGKTTAVYHRIVELKKEHPELLIGPHVENLGFCLFPINQESTRQTQNWVFSNHIQSELNLLLRYDIVVSDRSAVDVIAYTYAHGFTEQADGMLHHVQSHMAEYTEIIIMSCRKHNHHHADGRRDADPAFRVKVEEILLNLYERLGYTLDYDEERGVYLAVQALPSGL
jgi:hypothetical protein